MPKKRITHAELLRSLSYDWNSGVFTWLVVRRKRGGFTHVGEVAGSADSRGYLKVCLDGTSYYLHRLAIFYLTKRWPRNQVDHRNGRVSDNRYSNLRDATAVENGRNRKTGSNSTSGVVGVFFMKTTSLWRAHIKLEKRRLHLGDFLSKDAAIAARRRAEVVHFGAFQRGAK